MRVCKWGTVAAFCLLAVVGQVFGVDSATKAAQASAATQDELSPYIGYVRVGADDVSIEIPDQGVRLKADTKLPLFGSDERHYIAVLRDGRVCAFPRLVGRGHSSGWAGESSVFFIESVPSVAGRLVLPKDAEFPVLSKAGEAFEVLYVMPGGGRKGRLMIPRDTEGIVFSAERRPPAAGSVETVEELPVDRTEVEALREEKDALEAKLLDLQKRERRSQQLARRRHYENMDALKAARRTLLNLAAKQREQKEELQAMLVEKERQLMELEKQRVTEPLLPPPEEPAAADVTEMAQAPLMSLTAEVDEVDAAPAEEPDEKPAAPSRRGRTRAGTIRVSAAVVVQVFEVVLIVLLLLKFRRHVRGQGPKLAPLDEDQHRHLTDKAEKGEFMGELDVVDVVHLVEFLSMGEESGLLVIQRGGKECGSLLIQDGSVVCAETTAQIGDGAARELLKCRDGGFFFHRKHVVEGKIQRNVKTDTPSLLALAYPDRARNKHLTRIGKAKRPGKGVGKGVGKARTVRRSVRAKG